MDDFIDHVALVTGGGLGLGATISRELASRGAAIMVTDINESTAAKVAEEIVKAGGRASSMRHDTTDLKAMKQWWQRQHVLSATSPSQ